MLSKLRARFVTVTMSLIFVILVAIFSSIYFFMAQGQKTQTLGFMQDVSNAESFIGHRPPPMFAPNDGGRKQNAIENNALFSNSFIVFIDDSGEVTIRALSPSLNLEDYLDEVNSFLDLVEAQGGKSGIIKINGTQVRYLIRDKSDGEVIVFTDRSFELATLHRLAMVCSLIGFLSFIVIFVLTIQLSKWAIAPTAKAWEKQKQFVADASHELKTPLTVIATNADVVLSNPYDLVKDQSKWLTYIKTETERMTKLVNDLLYLAKIDDAEDLLHKSEFNISEAFTNSCLPFECVVFEEDKVFNMAIDPDIIYYGDESRLKQVAIILLDNAIKHTKESGAIDFKLSVDKTKNKLLLSVTNTGPGISEEHLPKLFERFYRADKSRARATGGYGLGLAIAKSIVEQHNGTISVVSSLEGPTTFTVALPYKAAKTTHCLFF